jgi:hypothetical protein
MIYMGVPKKCGKQEITVSELRDAFEKESATVRKGELCSVKINSQARRADKVFRRVDASSLKTD